MVSVSLFHDYNSDPMRINTQLKKGLMPERRTLQNEDLFNKEAITTAQPQKKKRIKPRNDEQKKTKASFGQTQSTMTAKNPVVNSHEHKAQKKQQNLEPKPSIQTEAYIMLVC